MSRLVEAWMRGMVQGLFLVLLVYLIALPKILSTRKKNNAAIRDRVAESDSWYSKAVKQGTPQTQFNLGSKYFYGQDVLQDYAEAVKFTRMAAEQGHGSAQFSLGFMFERGEGIPQDHMEAYIWYSLANAFGDKKANTCRDLVARELPPKSLRLAKKIVIRLTKEIQQRKKLN